MAKPKLGTGLTSEGDIDAAYVRVSTNIQAEEGYSIDIQKEKLTAYITKILGHDKFEVYVDDGFTGATLDRPAMQRLINDVKDSKIRSVLVVKLDRLSRSQKDTLYLIEDVFLAHGVSFVSLNESFDTSTPFGRAMVGILSVFAQLERENIYERTRGGMQKRVESGLWMGGGRVPFGYDYDKNKGVLVQNKDADRVRKLYDLYLQGYSLNYIADYLNLKYEKLARQILMRKSNAGYIVYNGVSYKGQHEAIIDLDTYNKAMLLMQEKSSNKCQSTGQYLLTGLVYCGVCGAKMRYSRWSYGRYKLTCYSQQTSKKYLIKDANCDNDKVWADDIENIVIKDIFAMSKRDFGEAVEKEEDEISTLSILKDQYIVTNNKLKKLYELYATIEDETLLSTIMDNKQALDNIRRNIEKEEQTQAVSKSVADKKMQMKNIEQAWDYMTDFERHNIIRSIVKRVTINKNEVTIDYNF